MTFAAGAVAITGMENAQLPALGHENVNLETEGRISGARWPTDGHKGENAPGRWLHSDFKNVALPFVNPLFQLMINRGQLK